MTKEYKTRSGRPFLAVNDVSLDVPANSITALLGPSGSGGDQSVSRVSIAVKDDNIYTPQRLHHAPGPSDSGLCQGFRTQQVSAGSCARPASTGLGALHKGTD